MLPYLFTQRDVHSTTVKESLKPRLELGTQTHNALRPACRTSSEETHDQELQELRKSHNEEVAALRNDNAGLKKKIVEQENSEKEMKCQIEFLSGMLRQAEARREEDTRASQRMSDEHHGSSVTMSVAKIVGKNLFLFSSPT